MVMKKKLGYQVCAIEITERCPLSCVGCYATKEGRDMSLEDFKIIIDKLPETVRGGNGHGSTGRN